MPKDSKMGNDQSLLCGSPPTNSRPRRSPRQSPGMKRASPYGISPKSSRTNGSSRSSVSPNLYRDEMLQTNTVTTPSKVQHSPTKTSTPEKVHSVIPRNLIDLADEKTGTFRGIQAPTESSLLSCILFAFFYKQDIFDNYLLKSNEQKQMRSGFTNNISKIRWIIENRIIKNMRTYPYFSSHNEWHFLEDLYSKDLLKMDKDPEYAFNFLFNEVLEIKGFLEFDKFETGFLHQLLCPRSLENGTHIRIADLISFKTNASPVLCSPFLILALKRVNYNTPFVFPTELNLLAPNADGALELYAVICIPPHDQGSWKAFVRCKNEADDSITWIFYDPQSQGLMDSCQYNIPKVELLPEFEKHLQYLRTSKTATANAEILRDGSIIGQRLRTLLHHGHLFIYYDPDDPRIFPSIPTQSLGQNHQINNPKVERTKKVQAIEGQTVESLSKALTQNSLKQSKAIQPPSTLSNASPKTPLSNGSRRLSAKLKEESQILSRALKSKSLEKPMDIDTPMTSTKVTPTPRQTDVSTRLSPKRKDDIPTKPSTSEANSIAIEDFRKLFISQYHQGKGFGLDGRDNSCYLDATLFAMLYISKIFDEWLLVPKLSRNPESPLGKRIRNILQFEIIDNLRGNHFVPYECTSKLRQALGEINPKLLGSMMDVDELINTLMGKALELRKFIYYSIGTSNYLHQIVIDTKRCEETVTNVQSLLEASMMFQTLKFQDIPCPALIIKMPRSQGKLLGYDEILPNLTLNINRVMEDAGLGSEVPLTRMELGAVIVLKNCHYTTYVRLGLAQSSHWLYFDSMPARVKLIPHLGEELELAQEIFEGRLSGGDREWSRHFHRLITNIHVCIYYSPEVVLQAKQQLRG